MAVVWWIFFICMGVKVQAAALDRACDITEVIVLIIRETNEIGGT